PMVSESRPWLSRGSPSAAMCSPAPPSAWCWDTPQPGSSSESLVLQHRRIVPQQRPAHDLDRRISLLQKRIVEALQRIFIALHLLVIFPELQNLQLTQRVHQ